MKYLVRKISLCILAAGLFCLPNASYSQGGAALSIAANSGYVEVYNASSLYTLNTGTLSFWFKVTNLSTDALLFSTSNKGTAGVNNNEFYISYRNYNKSFQVIGVNNGAITLNSQTPANTITDNNWHNITVVADGAGALEVYIDAVLSTLSVNACCSGTTNDFFFGGAGTLNNMKIGALERNTLFLAGALVIDDFRIWNIALTQCQVSASITSPSFPPVTGLVLYYDFESFQNYSLGFSGTNDIQDKTGNSYNGDVISSTLVGTSVAYTPVNSLTIDNNKFVEVYNASSLYSLATGTVSYWFQMTSLTADAILFSVSNKGTVSVNNNEFYISYRNYNKSFQVVGVNNGTITLNSQTPANTITDNNWHNMTVVADGTGAIEVYIDAVLSTLSVNACCSGTTNDFFFSAAGTLDNMKIGALERNCINTSGAFVIDDFRIWNSALSASQVKNTINGKSIIPQCNLKLYYDFNSLQNLSVGNAGTNDVADLTGNTYHGDLVSPAITSFSPVSGPVGSTVIITGSNFTGATSVKFNGVSASYTVNSATQITATVPTGATTGAITVAIASPCSVTLTSGTNYTVTTGIRENVATGVEDVFTDLNASAAVRIYPNPSQGEFTILAPGRNSFKVILYNSLGEIILTENATGESYTIADRKLSKGIYTIQIIGNGKTIQEKLVIN